MSTDQVRQQVSNLPLLHTVPSALASKLTDIILEVSSPDIANAGTVLFQKDEPATDVGIVLLEGEVTVNKIDTPEIAAYAPDLLGEMAQLNPAKQRTADVTAATQLQLLRFKWSDFKNVAQQQLSQQELEKFTSALQEHAWQHFTQ